MRNTPVNAVHAIPIRDVRIGMRIRAINDVDSIPIVVTNAELRKFSTVKTVDYPNTNCDGVHVNGRECYKSMVLVAAPEYNAK